MPKLISIYNCKGGVGKTTVAVSLARELAGQGQHVLLVDADSQCNATQMVAGMKAGESMKQSNIEKLFDAHSQTGPIDVPSYCQHFPLWGIELLPGSLTLARRDMAHLFNKQRDQRHWQTFMPLTAAPHDIVIFDCAPSFTLATMCALCASHMVVAPVASRDELSLLGVIACARLLEQLAENLQQVFAPHVPAYLAGMVINAKNSNQNHAAAHIQNTRAEILADDRFQDYRLFDSYLPRSGALMGQDSLGAPVQDLNFWKNCRGFAQEVLEVI